MVSPADPIRAKLDFNRDDPHPAVWLLFLDQALRHVLDLADTALAYDQRQAVRSVIAKNLGMERDGPS